MQPTTTVSQLLFLCGVTSSTPSRVHPFLDLLCRNKPTPRDKRGPACHQLIQCLLHDMPQLCCAVAWFRYSHLPQRTRQVMKLWKDTQNRKKMCGFRTYMMMHSQIKICKAHAWDVDVPVKKTRCKKTAQKQTDEGFIVQTMKIQ